MRVGKSKTHQTAIALLLSAVLGLSGTALAGSYRHNFTVDQSQSTIELYMYVNLGFPLGDDDDSGSSPVLGSVRATLTPELGDFTAIHVTYVDFNLAEDLSLSLFGGLMTVQGSNVALRLGDGYGLAGAPASVTATNFDQTGNLVQGLGTVTYDSSLGSGSYELVDDPPGEADFTGTVYDDGSTITLTFPINMPLDLGEGIDGYGILSGTIVAEAPSSLLPGDVTSDGWVGGADLTAVITNWGMTGASREQGDLSGDGTVSGPDYTEVITYWGTGTAPAEVIPEPGTLWLLLVAGSVLFGPGSKGG